MSDILLAEYTLKRALKEHTMDLVATSSPHILCTPLPKHWRSNKSLPNQFRVISLVNIADGTRVSLTAGNEERPCAELKNPVTLMQSNEARFSDLRFLGRSGRGKSFNITVTIEASPPVVAIYSRAIKVTVDGPRVPRNKYASLRAAKLHKESHQQGIRHGDSSTTASRMIRGIKHASNTMSQTSSRRIPGVRRVLVGSDNQNAFKAGSLGPSNERREMNRSHPPSLHCNESVMKFPEISNNCQPADSYITKNRPPINASKGLLDRRLFSTSNEPGMLFIDPIESSLLLFTLNEAYIRLMQRQADCCHDNDSREKCASSENSNWHAEKNPMTNGCSTTFRNIHYQHSQSIQRNAFSRRNMDNQILSCNSALTSSTDGNPQVQGLVPHLPIPTCDSSSAFLNGIYMTPNLLPICKPVSVPTIPMPSAVFASTASPTSNLPEKIPYTHQYYSTFLQNQTQLLAHGTYGDKTDVAFSYNNDPGYAQSISSLLTAVLINKSMPPLPSPVYSYDKVFTEYWKHITPWLNGDGCINNKCNNLFKTFATLPRGQVENEHDQNCYSKLSEPPKCNGTHATISENILSVDRLLDSSSTDKPTAFNSTPSSKSTKSTNAKFTTDLTHTKPTVTTSANVSVELLLRKQTRQQYFGT